MTQTACSPRLKGAGELIGLQRHQGRQGAV